ncbi:MAG: hypothetical protein WCC36_19410 [Gammaproteobacteria bacterium]
MSTARVVLWVLLVALLAGCAPWHVLDRRPHGPTDASRYDEQWLAQVQKVYDLRDADLSQALKRRQTAVAADPSAANELRLALLFAFAGPQVRDDSKALDLSRQAAAKATHRDTYILAHHVEAVVRERIGARRERERLNREAVAQKARADALQEKLNALKSIEESLNRRTKDQDTGVSP